MQTITERVTTQQELLARIKTAAARHAESGAELIVLLAHAKAVDAAEALGYPSLFAFCKDELLLSRDQTYRYLACATVYARHPQILPALRSGRLSVTGVSALASYVKTSSVADGAAALTRAEGRTVEAIESLAVELMPKPDVPCVVKAVVSKPASTLTLAFAPQGRALEAPFPNPSTSLSPAQRSSAPSPCTPSAPAPSPVPALPPSSSFSPRAFTCDATPSPLSAGSGVRDSVLQSHVNAPGPGTDSARSTCAKTTRLSPTSYKLTMTLSAEAYEQLRELRDLNSHTVPHGELDKIVVRAIEVALVEARKAKQKMSNRRSASLSCEPPANTSSHRTRLVDQTEADAGGRYIPAAVRRAVWRRDAGCCAFVGLDGRRCGSTWQVELDHVIRVADGGASTEGNLRLCCRRHNQARERNRGLDSDIRRPEEGTERNGAIDPTSAPKTIAVLT